MKELISGVLEAGGKWFAKMFRASPRAFFAGLGLGMIVLLSGAYVLLGSLDAKPQIVWFPQDRTKEGLPTEGKSNKASARASEDAVAVRDQGRNDVVAPRTLKVTRPIDGEAVPETIEIEGMTPYPNRNHYVLVTPETGSEFMQDDALKVSANGGLTGQATIGSASVGAHQKFLIRVLATQADLTAGFVEPPDAILSPAITVYRK